MRIAQAGRLQSSRIGIKTVGLILPARSDVIGVMTSGVRHTVPLALYTSDAGDVIATRHGRRLESDVTGRRSGVPDVNEGTLSVRARNVVVRGGGGVGGDAAAVVEVAAAVVVAGVVSTAGPGAAHHVVAVNVAAAHDGGGAVVVVPRGGDVSLVGGGEGSGRCHQA